MVSVRMHRYAIFHAFVALVELPLITLRFVIAARQLSRFSRARALSSTAEKPGLRRDTSSSTGVSGFLSIAPRVALTLVGIAGCALLAFVFSAHGEARVGRGASAVAFTSVSWCFLLLAHVGIVSLLMRCSLSVLTLMPSGDAQKRARTITVRRVAHPTCCLWSFLSRMH